MSSLIAFCRHGEREDYAASDQGRGKEWIQESERPWDPALTPLGKQQAASTGEALATYLQANGLPPVTRVFVSPYTRTVESGLACVEGIQKVQGGELKVCVEESIGEVACEAWFRSWGIEGESTGRWGGPFELKRKKVRHLMKEEVKLGVHNLILPPVDMAKRLNAQDKIDVSYQTVYSFANSNYTFDNQETFPVERKRIKAFIDHILKTYPGETVLCATHGSPVSQAHKIITGERGRYRTDYACLSLYQHQEKRKFNTLLSADVSHLANIGAGRGGGDGK